MLTSERHSLILDRLHREGRIVAKDLSQELDLSEDTIRRDLRALAATGRLQRVHGGALPSSPALAKFADRKIVSAEGKAAIARRAAAMIAPGQVVFLDGGTTAEQVVHHLAPELEATIVTHSPSVAAALATHPAINVELIGGRLFKHSVVATGTAAAAAIQRVRADLFLMGVTGVHAEFGLTTGDAEEAAIKALLCRQAAETVVLASNEKLGAVSPYLVVPLAEVNAIIVEHEARHEITSSLRTAGVDIVRAEDR